MSLLMSFVTWFRAKYENLAWTYATSMNLKLFLIAFPKWDAIYFGVWMYLLE